jgi:serine/threonine-protein kinase
VTLYEMLTGRKPFQADTSYTVLNAQLNQAPTPPLEINPSLSPELNGIVLRAMAKAPEERFQTADEFRSALKALREPKAVQIAQPAAQVPQYTQYAAPPPAFTPVPPPPGPPPAVAKTHRGLWIGLGAATAILALIAVAALLPRIFSTSAKQKPPVVAADAAMPATSPASTPQPQTPPPDTTQPPASSTSAGTPVRPADAGTSSQTANGSKPQTSSDKPRKPYVSSASTPASGTSQAEAGSPTAPPAGPSPRDVRDAHDRYANIEARADSALAGVEQIRSQQQAQGFDIRGDILAAMNRLHHQLNEAQNALNAKDLDTANEYMNRADAETTRLEKFLGR